MKRLNRDKLIALLIIVVLVGIAVILCIDLLPLLQNISTHIDDESAMIASIDAYGNKGLFILVALQTLQVITAFFPAPAVQALAGLCYGVWTGMLICLAGYILGNLLVFSAVRLFNTHFAPLFAGKNGEEKGPGGITSQFIDRMKRPELFAFLLYFIPGLPNGILPYIFARTKISLAKYMTIIISASVPSILICTLVGDRFAKGDKLTSLIIIVAMVVVFCVAFIFRKRILALIERKTE